MRPKNSKNKEGAAPLLEYLLIHLLYGMYKVSTLSKNHPLDKSQTPGL
jgi:hypothetical protein